jgi:hypothetical protein
MNRIPVTSSTISSVYYDPRTQTLEVEFHSGAVYQYFDVPQSVYDAFMSAESKGVFLNSNIKGVYRFARL